MNATRVSRSSERMRIRKGISNSSYWALPEREKGTSVTLICLRHSSRITNYHTENVTEILNAKEKLTEYLSLSSLQREGVIPDNGNRTKLGDRRDAER